ncbi:MAG: phage protease [Sulfuricella denitrificans]|nr:phage protease [Sulfuricella denitrificans]
MQVRTFRLSDDSGAAGVIRFLSGFRAELAEGKTSSWVTVTRTGKFSDPRYGAFDITRDMLLSMVRNFDARTFGQDIFIDVNHQPGNGAAGKVAKLAVEGDRLRALVEWTPFGVDAIKEKGYAYLSAEYSENFKDNEQGAQHGPLLLGAALTVRPVIKRLDPVRLSCDSDSGCPVLLHPELTTTLLQEISVMKDKMLKKLAALLAAKKLAQANIDTLTAAFDKALADTTDESKAELLLAEFDTIGKQLAEAVGDKATTIQLSVPSLGMTQEDVKKLLAEESTRQAEAAKTLAEKKDANLKALTDALAAAPGLDEETRKTLAADVADLITPEMTAAQVTSLANMQIKHGNEVIAARKLASMGFAFPAGNVHITVDSSNEAKALQDVADRRLGLSSMPDSRRFATTGGALQPENKALAEKVLAAFDAANGRQLHAEHKMLAAGDSIVSDVAVPATFERTVLREALFRLVGLQFVDSGTAAFAATTQIPYSYRDTAAAGIGNVRKYEGQAIARAGVKQAMETAYIIPQKLAFEVSDELRYLTANGQLVNWDAVAENTTNAYRIIAEDLEAMIFNEQLNASDQYASTAVTNEAVATADGTKSIFVTNQFPVVRPKLVYDLQGSQVGSTLFGVTVTSNAVGITAWDGTGTQTPGLYYWMDYNLGEIHFVDAAGAPSAPTNTHAIVASYTYTTNVYKFDTDLGSATVGAKWDDFLYRFGLRKSVIEDQRSHMCNFGLMSGTVMTSVEQADSFVESRARNGSSLAMDGNLGVIKDVAQYKAYAPGLNMGDQRVIVGERAQTRFRMAKPWAMGQLQDQKDANGRFTGKKEAYGDQFIFLHTPTQLKAALTSVVLYSASARVDR